MGVFEQLPEGWEAVEIGDRIRGRVAGVMGCRRGVGIGWGGCIWGVEMGDEGDEEKMEEATQPSIADKSQLINSYLKIEIGDYKAYVNFTKKAEIDIGMLRFRPIAECLY